MKIKIENIFNRTTKLISTFLKTCTFCFNDKIIILSLFIINIILKTKPLSINHPFWVDEFSTANFAKMFLWDKKTVGLKKAFINLTHEQNNLTTHLLVALFYTLLDITTSNTRLPIVIISIFVPILFFIFIKKIYSKKIAIVSSFFLTFSYFELIWSTQARGYPIQQFLILILFIISTKPLTNIKNIILFTIVSIIGLFTHKLFIFPILSIIIANFIFKIFKNKFDIKKSFKTFALILIFIFLTILPAINLTQRLIQHHVLYFVNNVWYYHAFIYKYHQFLFFMAILGIIRALSINIKETFKILLHILFNLIFVFFLFYHHMTKYIFPIWMWFILFSSIGIIEFSNFLFENIYKLSKENIKIKINDKDKKYIKNIFLFFFSSFILKNGDQFQIKPLVYYSPNHFMREIPLINQDLLYSKIILFKNEHGHETAFIDTLKDRQLWFLGIHPNNYFLFKWQNQGPMKYANFILKSDGTKEIINQTHEPIGIYLISTLSDIQKVHKKYKYGFMIIDDVSLPKEVIDYAQNNFKLIGFYKHYEYDDNPYSIWETRLYFWDNSKINNYENWNNNNTLQ